MTFRSISFPFILLISSLTLMNGTRLFGSCSALSKDQLARSQVTFQKNPDILSYCSLCGDHAPTLVPIKQIKETREKDGTTSLKWISGDGKGYALSLSTLFVPDSGDLYKNLAIIAKCEFRDSPHFIKKTGEESSIKSPDALTYLPLSGFYFIKNRKPKDVFSSLGEVHLDTGDNRPTEGSIETKSGRLKFDHFERKEHKISFSTQTIKGIRYSFEGELPAYREILDSGEIKDDGSIQLKGKLTKTKNGKTVEEGELEFDFSVGC